MRQFLIVCTVLLGHTAVVAADPLARRDERSYLSNGSITIAGTLSLPAGRGPFSTVVLLSGSGPENRDSEVSGFRPFKLMADFSLPPRLMHGAEMKESWIVVRLAAHISRLQAAVSPSS